MTGKTSHGALLVMYPVKSLARRVGVSPCLSLSPSKSRPRACFRGANNKRLETFFLRECRNRTLLHPTKKWFRYEYRPASLLWLLQKERFFFLVCFWFRLLHAPIEYVCCMGSNLNSCNTHTHGVVAKGGIRSWWYGVRCYPVRPCMLFLFVLFLLLPFSSLY
jgi:hypothetical protein